MLSDEYIKQDIYGHFQEAMNSFELQSIFIFNLIVIIFFNIGKESRVWFNTKMYM